MIVSYVYPPNKGVGGRRWSMFAKDLAKSGNEVFVITATPDENGNFSGQKIDGVTITRVKSPYPNILRYMGKMNLFHKIQYRLTRKYYRLTQKGNIFDTSVGWDVNLIPAIKNLIEKEQIKNVVVTAPPYRHMCYVAELKSIYPDLNIILDFRDPWAEIKSFNQLFYMPAKHLAAEAELEKQALAKADCIVSVSEERTRLLAEFSNKPEQCFTISNGIDLRDYDFLKNEPSENGYFSIVHAGTLNPGYIKTVTALVNFVNANKEKLREAKVVFEFCGHVNSDMLAVLKRAPEDLVISYGLLPQKEALRILNKASAGLIIIKDGYENIHFITKLYEYMALRKKIIYLSSSADYSLSQFLTEKKIGVTFTRDNLNLLLTWLVYPDRFNALSYGSFDISPYETINLSKKVEALLK